MSTTAPMDRTGLEVLSTTECLVLLESQPIGRVAFIDAGEAVCLPVNFVVEGRSIYFRSASGSKLERAWRNDAVTFEVDEFDAEDRTGWSVVVKGTADLVTGDDELARLVRTELEPWADVVGRDHWIRVLPNEITGRRIVRR